MYTVNRTKALPILSYKINSREVINNSITIGEVKKKKARKDFTPSDRNIVKVTHKINVRCT